MSGPITKELHAKIQEAQGIISLYADSLKMTVSLRGLYSGGKDSTVACHLAAQHQNWRGVAHVRTMTGPASIRYSDSVKKRAAEYGWDWIEAQPAITLPALVAMFGLSGPAMHNVMFRYLKERPIRQLAKMVRAQDKTKRVVWVSGIRAAESAARAHKSMVHTPASNAEWFINPILNWSDDDVFAYLNAFDLDVQVLSHSLDCYCGAYATPDEKELLKTYAPDQYEYIQTLEVLARAARQLQLLNAMANSDQQTSIIPESMCTWGHGLNTKTREEREPNVMLCANCSTRRLETLLDAIVQQEAA